MVSRKTRFITFRVDEKLYNLIKRVAWARGEEVSDFVRIAVKMRLAKLSCLSDEEKKVLLAP